MARYFLLSVQDDGTVTSSEIVPVKIDGWRDLKLSKPFIIPQGTMLDILFNHYPEAME